MNYTIMQSYAITNDTNKYKYNHVCKPKNHTLTYCLKVLLLQNIGCNRVFYKVRTTRHQYPKFGPKPGEIQENV